MPYFFCTISLIKLRVGVNKNILDSYVSSDSTELSIQKRIKSTKQESHRITVLEPKTNSGKLFMKCKTMSYQAMQNQGWTLLLYYKWNKPSWKYSHSIIPFIWLSGKCKITATAMRKSDFQRFRERSVMRQGNF